MGFIEDFHRYTKEAESPTSYFHWTAVSILSATLRDNVYLKLGLQTVYPNLFILLLSKSSSNTRKGTPLKIAGYLLKELGNTHVLTGRKSFQGIIKRLSNVQQNGKKVVKGGSAILINEELAANLVQDPQLGDTLTDWFDYHKTWSNMLSSLETAMEINNVCVSMLSAANEANVDSLYDGKAIMGGLLARTLVVAEQKRRFKNSLMYTKLDFNDKNLLLYLEKVSRLKGPMQMSSKAKRSYDDWYNSVSDDDLSDSGIEGRISTIILKVSMCYSLSQSLDKTITEAHIKAAIQDCVGLISNARQIIMGRGKSATSSSGHKILMLLYEAEEYSLPSSQIIRDLFGDLSWLEFTDIREKMRNANITEEYEQNGDIYLRLTRQTIELFKKKLTKSK